MNEALKIIQQLDYSRSLTTARSHCIELYSLCLAYKPQSVLELGAGIGVSGVAIGLACPTVKATVVDIGLIPRSTPQALWDKYGIQKDYVKSDAGAWLKAAEGQYDFIFHDADHGNKVIPEYHDCWRLTAPGGVLTIHDVDLIHYKKFVLSLKGVYDFHWSYDIRHRALGVIVKA